MQQPAQAFLALLLVTSWMSETPDFMERCKDFIEISAGTARISRLAHAAGTTRQPTTGCTTSQMLTAPWTLTDLLAFGFLVYVSHEPFQPYVAPGNRNLKLFSVSFLPPFSAEVIKRSRNLKPKNPQSRKSPKNPKNPTNPRNAPQEP